MNPFDKQIPDDIELQRIRAIVAEEVADIPTGPGGGSASRSKAFYRITVTADLVFGLYANHSGTVTKAEGISNIKRNNGAITVPFVVAVGDIITGQTAAAGTYTLELELNDTTVQVSGFMGVESSWNKGVSGYARCYNSFVFEMYGLTFPKNGIVDINNDICINADTQINAYGNFDHNRILSNNEYTVFASSAKLITIRNLDKQKFELSVGHNYNSLMVFKESNLLFNHAYGTSQIVNIALQSVLYTGTTTTLLNCADLSGQTAFYTYSNNFRSIRNGILSSAYALTGAYGVLCSGFVYITGTNIIIKVNDATDQVMASLTLNGNARRILQIGEKLYCGTSTGWVYEIDIPTFTITRSVNTGIATGHDIVDIGGGYILLTSYDVNTAVRINLSDFTWRSYAINVQPHRIHLDLPNGLIAFAKFSELTTGFTNVYKLSNFLTP